VNALEKLTAGAAKLVQIADNIRESKTQIALKEIASSIRGATATIRNAIEAEAEKPPAARRFALLQGDESPLPSGKLPKTITTPKGSK